MRQGICPKCKELKSLTRHHVYFKAHFGGGKRNQVFEYLCRKCHDAFHNTTINHKRMPRPYYREMLEKFLAPKP